MIRSLFHCPAQLRQRDHRNIQLTCQRLQSAGDIGDLLLPEDALLLLSPLMSCR